MLRCGFRVMLGLIFQDFFKYLYRFLYGHCNIVPEHKNVQRIPLKPLVKTSGLIVELQESRLEKE